MQFRQPEDIEASPLGVVDQFERLGEGVALGLALAALKFVEHTKFHGRFSRLLWIRK
jgi:hypothetical protein